MDGFSETLLSKHVQTKGMTKYFRRRRKIEQGFSCTSRSRLLHHCHPPYPSSVFQDAGLSGKTDEDTRRTTGNFDCRPLVSKSLDKFEIYIK